MSLFCRSAIPVAFLLFSFPALSQDTEFISTDSVPKPSLVLSPDLTSRPVESVHSFSTTINNKFLSHSYAGTSVLNLLRGSVASLQMDPALVFANTAGFRNSSTMLSVDGIPFHPEIGSFQNMNAFEYESISVASNANNNFSYGAAGVQGGIFLRSKSGENISKPSFEFNSYTSRNLTYKDPVSLEPDDATWAFSNSIAYAQDFGVVDLRASYNFASIPFADTDEGYDRAHAFRLNGGVNAGRFSARIIGEFRQEKYVEHQSLKFGALVKFLNGNALLQYRINDWLKITSQHLVSKANLDSYVDYNSDRLDRDSNQPRQLHNAIVSLDKKVSDSFGVRAHAGYQFDKLETDLRMVSSFQGSTQLLKEETKSIFGGVGFDINNIFYLDLNARKEDYDGFPYFTEISTWGAGASFVVSRLLVEDDSRFTAKLRSSIGKTNNSYAYHYPVLINLFSISFPSGTPLSNWDIGADFALADGRMTVSSSYYHYTENDVALRSPDNNAIIPIGEFKKKGFELVAGVSPNLGNEFKWNARLTYNNPRARIRSDLSQELINDLVPGGPIADWAGSMFNQFEYKNVFLNILVDIRQGGNIFVYDNMYTPMIELDGSFTKFRDITLGYGFGPEFLERINLDSAFISVSGRNLIQFNEKEFDAERYGIWPYLKSVSVSLSVGF